MDLAMTSNNYRGMSWCSKGGNIAMMMMVTVQPAVVVLRKSLAKVYLGLLLD